MPCEKGTGHIIADVGQPFRAHGMLLPKSRSYFDVVLGLVLKFDIVAVFAVPWANDKGLVRFKHQFAMLWFDNARHRHGHSIAEKTLFAAFWAFNRIE